MNVLIPVATGVWGACMGAAMAVWGKQIVAGVGMIADRISGILSNWFRGEVLRQQGQRGELPVDFHVSERQSPDDPPRQPGQTGISTVSFTGKSAIRRTTRQYSPDEDAANSEQP